MIEQRRYFDIEVVIVDEFHMVQDVQRGYLLETIITKLNTIQRMFNQQNRYQIIAMSATISGLSILKKWLGTTEVFHCNDRPVPLSQYVYRESRTSLNCLASLSEKTQASTAAKTVDKT